ncbi:substrate-binding domain-containing protein [Streptosporangium sp. NPDC000396]|uniref:substrate-binding domain-containing protein n=1 Tax=Streptosporangium sp. NPDC000396 TaxID=3366185 RepID=UPI0036B971B1
MYVTRNTMVRVVVLAVTATVAVTGCSGEPTGALPVGQSSAGSCPRTLANATAAVRTAAAIGARWTGPTSGPPAATGKTVVFVAHDMTNPGVAGVAKGVRDAGQVIGWNARVVDGQGTPAGIQAAFSQAVTLRPDGIVIGGFDPNSASGQTEQANAAGIPLIGWHAVGVPGPSENPRLFTNITTKVEDVARISADWIITTSGGRAGAVILTDSSIPFAENKSQLIKKELETCPSVRLLSYENIPIADASIRVPQKVSSLLSRFGDRWTHSVAINDLYFAAAAPALRAAGRRGDAEPFNVGAGDGDPSAFQRIRDRQFQSATVPEPLNEQGWQIIDEFNRAFSGRPDSGYVAPVHLTTVDNVGTTTAWDPLGYQEAYRKIWGR